MRSEYVEYEYNLPVSIRLLTIEDYPTVWQDSTRIFLVLKGGLRVTIANEDFNLYEREIEIVNIGEIYSLKGLGDNLVLLVDISPRFFRDYVDNVDRIYYYTDTLDGSRQWDQKYQVLRSYLAIIYYEYLTRQEAYETRLEKNLLDMMYHLLNNFHHLYYEEESLREDELQFERFNRIINYLRENYRERVSLGEIAQKEYLTSQYLSYKIKDTFGQSFNDFLNKIRVEESRKLLLNTDKSISEIALETGFSHSRYYNKHFEKLYGLSPADYRASYQLDRKELEARKNFKEHRLDLALDYMEEYLLDYSGYGDLNRKLRRTIDIEAPPIFTDRERPGLILEDFSFLEDQESKEALRQLVEDIGPGSCFLGRAWWETLASKEVSHKDILELRAAFKFLEELDLAPVVLVENRDQAREILKKFKGWQSDLMEYRAYKGQYRTLDLGRENDSLEILGPMLDQLVLKRQGLVFSFRDQAVNSQGLKNPSFYGGQGLLTSDYLKKPSYYCLEILSRLEGDFIHAEAGLLATATRQGFQILIYNGGQESEFLGAGKLSLNILGLRKDYILRSYRLDRQSGSNYSIWQELGGPRRLEKSLIEELKEFNRPKLSYKKVSRSNVYNIIHRIEGQELVLLDFKPMDS